MRSSLFLLGVFAACARPPEPAPIPTTLGQRAAPSVVSRTTVGGEASGVTVDANGKRFVWVRGAGLHELTANGLVLALSATSLGTAPLPDIEDAVIVDANRLAVIAKNEGYVVGLTTGQIYNRFCYLPGGPLPSPSPSPGPVRWQLSRSLGYDAKEDRLYVQPQSFTGERTLTDSELGVFDPSLPDPLEWQPLNDPTFAAGGMAVGSRERIFFGMGTRLYQYDATARRYDAWWDLDGVVSSIEGLALDRVSGTLLVLDAQEVVELRLDSGQ